MGHHVALTDIQIVELNNEYLRAASKARNDPSYKSDLEAALLAPVAFLRNPDTFEVTFDAIIHHLDEALKKAASEEAKYSIQRTAEELFHSHVYIIEAKINYIKEMKNRTWLVKIKDFIKGTTSLLDMIDIIGLVASYVPKIADLLVAYFEKLALEWKIKQQEEFFYNQLGNVYQKILNSQCFTGQHALLQNTFSRTKPMVLPQVIHKKGLAAAINLMEFDKFESELQESANIIFQTLIVDKNWEGIINFASLIKPKKLVNYGEMENNILRSYKADLEHSPGCLQSLFGLVENIMPLIAIGAFLVICVLLCSIFPVFPKFRITWQWNYLFVPLFIVLFVLVIALIGDFMRKIWQTLIYTQYKMKLKKL
ncbi:MAG: hypothetical protein ACOYYU_04055 [Chloroflexota bacterium]